MLEPGGHSEEVKRHNLLLHNYHFRHPCWARPVIQRAKMSNNVSHTGIWAISGQVSGLFGYSFDILSWFFWAPRFARYNSGEIRRRATAQDEMSHFFSHVLRALRAKCAWVSEPSCSAPFCDTRSCRSEVPCSCIAWKYGNVAASIAARTIAETLFTKWMFWDHVFWILHNYCKSTAKITDRTFTLFQQLFR